MSWLTSVLIALQVLCAIAIIVLVLLQHGKGADMGAAFGSGASGSLFGATGSANFLSRMTGIVAAVFFAATLGLAWTSNHMRGARPAESGGVMSTVGAPADTKSGGAAGGKAAAKGEGKVDGATPADAGKASSDIPK